MYYIAFFFFQQEAIKRAGDLRTRRTPHQTDPSGPDDIKGKINY